MKYHDTFIHSKVSSTQNQRAKIRDCHFSLVWLMEFRITYSCLGKVKVLPINYSLSISADVQVCMKTVNEFCMFNPFMKEAAII